MRVAQLKDEELAFLIQVGRVIFQSHLGNRNAALLNQLLAEYDRRYPRQDTSRITTQGSANALITCKCRPNPRGDASSKRRTVGPLAFRFLTHRFKTFDRKSLQ